MKNDTKNDYLQIRVTREEKEEIRQECKKQGFDSVSAYLLWLFRKFGKKD
jgi:hypothetical protein